MRTYDSLFIGGRWVASHSNQVIEVRSPATLEVVGRCPEAVEADVDDAVAAARAAFDDGAWSQASPVERATVLHRLSAIVKERAGEMAALVSAEMGAPIGIAEPVQIAPGLTILDYYANLAETFGWEETRTGAAGQSRILREPVGVVAAVIPWNFPFCLAITKLAPALVAGCTVVLKPAPETPLDALLLAEWITEAGLPEGVLSVIPGGREVGEYLVGHRGIDKISFTGSTAAGRQVAAAGAASFKRVSLELGGKSAAILLDDVDLTTAMPSVAILGLLNSGQLCVAQTRVLAPRSRYEEVLEAMVGAVGALAVGSPSDPASVLGPLVAERQRDRVESYIAKGKAEGARLVLGGGRPEKLDTGWYVESTIFADVDNAMTIAQEEIFGPVLSVIPYDSQADAVRIANDSDYGLAGSVWTSDVERGLQVARRVRTGTYGINGYDNDMGSPFGGYKQSGIGRENGPEGLAAYCETKSVLMPAGYGA